MASLKSIVVPSLSNHFNALKHGPGGASLLDFVPRALAICRTWVVSESLL